jgi:hypothetical protein
MGTLFRFLGCLAYLTACNPFHSATLTELSECDKACAKWDALGCEEGEPVCDQIEEPNGECSRFISCKEWCVNVQQESPVKMQLRCFIEVEAHSCEELRDKCSQG